MKGRDVNLQFLSIPNRRFGVPRQVERLSRIVQRRFQRQTEISQSKMKWYTKGHKRKINLPTKSLFLPAGSSTFEGGLPKIC